MVLLFCWWPQQMSQFGILHFYRPFNMFCVHVCCVAPACLRKLSCSRKTSIFLNRIGLKAPQMGEVFTCLPKTPIESGSSVDLYGWGLHMPTESRPVTQARFVIRALCWAWLISNTVKLQTACRGCGTPRHEFSTPIRFWNEFAFHPYKTCLRCETHVDLNNGIVSKITMPAWWEDNLYTMDHNAALPAECKDRCCYFADDSVVQQHEHAWWKDNVCKFECITLSAKRLLKNML